MCLGAPGRVIEVQGRSAIADFWGTRKRVSLDGLRGRVEAGDYILYHQGEAVRVIDPSEAAETVALYELVLCDAGDDPLATNIVDEFAEDEVLELTPA